MVPPSITTTEPTQLVKIFEVCCFSPLFAGISNSPPFRAKANKQTNDPLALFDMWPNRSSSNCQATQISRTLWWSVSLWSNNALVSFEREHHCKEQTFSPSHNTNIYWIIKRYHKLFALKNNYNNYNNNNFNDNNDNNYNNYNNNNGDRQRTIFTKSTINNVLVMVNNRGKCCCLYLSV